MENKLVPEYQTKLETSLVVAKIGAIILLFIMAFFYNRNSKDSTVANTFLKNVDTRRKVLSTAAVTGLIASLTTLYIMGSRGFLSVFALLVIFFALFFYDVGLEASGVNRWLTLEETTQGHGIYAELNDLNPNDEEKLHKFKSSTEDVDPFYDAVMYSFITLVGIICLYLGWDMLNATRNGYNAGNNYVTDAIFWKGNLSPNVGFSLEMLSMALNGFIPLINAKIKGEEINKTVYTNMALFSGASMMIHAMVQYCGMYK